jgi:PAS domain S-box-containing protein
MNPAASIRVFILGHDTAESQVSFRNRFLRGWIALILLAVCLIYCMLDSLYGMYATLPYYAGLAAVSFIVLWLNRTHHTLAANVLLLLSVNAVITAFTLSDAPGGNVFIFFSTVSLTAVILFDYQERGKAVAFFLFTLACFLFAHFSDFKLLPPAQDPPEIARINFVINFFLATITSCVLLYTLIDINFITQRKVLAQEDEIKRNRMRFELAIKGSNAGIYEWNIATNIVYNSPVWKNMLGYHEDELPDLSLEGFLNQIHPEDQSKVAEAVKNHLDHREPYLVEFRLRKKDGSYLWVRDSGLAVWDDRGKPQLWIGSIIDITQSKESAQRIVDQNTLLAKANTELDQFVYRTSHDLRSPLSSIMGLVEVARKTERKEDVLHFLDLINNRAKAQDTLISEIIDYSRNARTDLELQAISLHDMVQEIFELYRFNEEMDRLLLLNEVDESVRIQTDLARMKSILSNLVNNAIKYRDESKPRMFVKVSAHQSEQGWRIAVADNGTGIRPEHINKVFNMFYRATDRSKGSGLGLFIVQEMADKLHGTITLETEYTRGSTFILHLPAT